LYGAPYELPSSGEIISLPGPSIQYAPTGPRDPTRGPVPWSRRLAVASDRVLERSGVRTIRCRNDRVSGTIRAPERPGPQNDVGIRAIGRRIDRGRETLAGEMGAIRSTFGAAVPSTPPCSGPQR